MFYAAEILSRDGRFGHIWLAAHMDKKLTKTQIFGVKIPAVVEEIIDPSKNAESAGLKISLRTSCFLMLGVVKIYQRKMQYLFHDCNETVYKIKTAFRHTNVDLPPDQTMAPFHSITMQDNEGDLSATLRLTNIDFALNETALNLTMNNTLADASQTQLRPDTRSSLTMNSTAVDDGFGMGELDESLLVSKFSGFRGMDPKRHADGRPSIESDIMFADRPVHDNFMLDPPADYNNNTSIFDDAMPPPEEPFNMTTATLDTTTAGNTSKLDRQPDERAAPVNLVKRRKLVYVSDAALQIDRKEYAKWQEPRLTEELQRPLKRAAVTMVTVMADPNWLETSLMNPKARAFVQRARAPLVLVEKPRAAPIPRTQRSQPASEPQAEAANTTSTDQMPPLDDGIPPPPMDDIQSRNVSFAPMDDALAPPADESFGSVMINESFNSAFAADIHRREPTAARDEGEEQRQKEEEEELTDAQRIQKVKGLLKAKFDETGKDELKMSDFLKKKERKATAAGLFYELLVLKTKGMIEVDQQEPFGEITIQKTAALVE